MNDFAITSNAKRSTNNRRKASGNLLAFACVCFAVVCIALIVGYSFASLFFVNNRLQNSADEIALAGAKKLNEMDRIGQINNMVARCRQLVFSSRKDFEETKKSFPHLENFAEPLLQEARDSADALEQERQRIAYDAQEDARTAMKRKFDEIKPTYPMVLPWLKVKTPALVVTQFGKLAEVDSNVEELKAVTELAKNDKSQGYLPQDSEPGLHLYKADTTDGLRLPGDDNDLTFKLSSLPAPVDGIIAPPRVVLPSKQQPIVAGNAPSVTRVSLRLDVETGLGVNTGATLGSTGTASTTGACIQQ